MEEEMNKADLARLFADSFDKFTQLQIDALAALMKNYVEMNNEKADKLAKEN